MSHLILAIAAFFVVLIIDVLSDLHTKDINHKRGALLRALFLMPSTFWFTSYYGAPIVLGALISVFMQASVFWHLFDGIYNTCRGHSWWFQGSEDGDEDAVTDNINYRLSIILKILLPILFINLYIFTRG